MCRIKIDTKNFGQLLENENDIDILMKARGIIWHSGWHCDGGNGNAKMNQKK